METFFDNELKNYGGTAVFKGILKKKIYPKLKDYRTSL